MKDLYIRGLIGIGLVDGISKKIFDFDESWNTIVFWAAKSESEIRFSKFPGENGHPFHNLENRTKYLVLGGQNIA